jgi:hypothetical protein
LLALFPIFSIAQSEQGRKTYNGQSDFDFEKHYLGNVIQTIDVDERTDFYEGYMIVRKNDQYAVLLESGELSVPFGKYLFNIQDYKALAKDELLPGTLVVRNSETGLYGIISTETGLEIVPCIYNSLSPFYGESMHAIGTITDLKQNIKTEYYINLDGEKRPMPKDIAAEKKNRYVKLYNKNKETQFYDVRDDKVVLNTGYKDVSYIGENLFLVKENFNGLKKHGFLDVEGELVIPFQNSESIAIILPFQPAYTLKQDIISVSILVGQGNHYFNFGMMDDTGYIFSKLKNGNGFQGLSFADGRKIISGKVLLTGRRDKDSKQGEFFWYVTEGEELVKIEEMYFYNFQYFAVLPKDIPTFQYQSRNGRVVVFNSRMSFTKQKKLLDIFPKAQPQWVSGGINSGTSSKREQTYVVEGVGVLSENGLLEIPPVFNKIDRPDPVSGLAYAELGYKGLLYKGYIETEGEKAGSFRFFVK